MAGHLLEVKDLSTHFFTHAGVVKAVNGVGFTLDHGETLSIVGESGSGKTVTALSLMRLVPDPPGKIVEGSLLLGGRDLRALSDDEMRQVRGNDIAMIFQDPMTSLNPVVKVGKQIAEVIVLHQGKSKSEAWTMAVELLARVGIPDAPARVKQYPFEFSGGMRQRVMIAMAISCNPDVLIADEPTTALDVTIQAQIIDVVREMQAAYRSGVILITHDLGVVAEIADKVMVMYGGRTVEYGSIDRDLLRPASPLHMGVARLAAASRSQDAAHAHQGAAAGPHLAAQGLPVRGALRLRARRVSRQLAGSRGRGRGARRALLDPRGRARRAAPHAGERQERERVSLLEVRDLKKYFPIKSGVLRKTTGQVYAVDGVSFSVEAGETLGLVGESGCGKSTTGRTVLRLIQATAGTVTFEGVDVMAASRSQMQTLRRHMQIIFQDPYASLNPRMRVRNIVGESLDIHDIGTPAERKKRVSEFLETVGLSVEHAERYPHEFSGGQRQRIGIARALALNPKLIICDEPVSALDVSIRAQVINLLKDLQKELGLTYLFIAHDLSLVKHASDRVAVMYLGKIVEVAGSDTLYDTPQHPYTEALLSAVPIPDPETERGRRRIILEGDVPSPANPPSGCVFHPRCQRAQDVCATAMPTLVSTGGDASEGHQVACYFPARFHEGTRSVGALPFRGEQPEEQA